MCVNPIILKNGTKVRCGKCIECRLQTTNDWVLRCKNELKLYDKAVFITLTYNPESLPPKGSLRKADFQKFMKRLRKHFQPSAIRYFASCEYGSNTSRPHYHAILFGVDFPDMYYFKTDKKGVKLYRSSTLERLWTLGFSSLGAVNDTTIKYCCKYLVPLDDKYYKDIEKPCLLMSRRPGIGMLNIPDSVFKDFSLYVDGEKIKAPKAYIRKAIELDYRLKERYMFMCMSVTQRKLFELTHEKHVEFIDGIEYSYWKDIPIPDFEYFITYNEDGSSVVNYIIDNEDDWNFKCQVDKYCNILNVEYYDNLQRLELRRKKFKNIFDKCIDKFFKPVYNFSKKIFKKK